MQRFSRTALAVHSATAAAGAVALGTLLVVNPKTPDAWVAVPVVGAVAYVALRMQRWIRRSLGPREPGDAVVAVLESLPYYRRLHPDEQARFREHVCWFLSEHRITGVDVEVDDELRALIASSAVTLTFGLPGYEWESVREVLVYPSAFDRDLDVYDDGERVGEFSEQGPIIFSAPDLRDSWEGEDGFNVGLHEFAHQLDYHGGGELDGVPAHLGTPAMNSQWEAFLRDHLRDPRRNRKLFQLLEDGAWEDGAELFAHLTEIFFELPDTLEPIAPEAYRMLCALYRQDPLARIRLDERQPLLLDDTARDAVVASLSR